MTNFVFVTHSTGKLSEAERILGRKLDHRGIDLPEIQAVDVEAVVIFKAKEAYAQLNQPVLIEDTGLYIEAWNGLPGALIKWFVERLHVTGICQLMESTSNRQAWAKTVVATYDGLAEPRLFTGQVDGHIALTPAGTGGFGWDPLFIPTGSNKTFAEMSAEEKDAFSMRRQAFEAMAADYNRL